MWDTKLITDKPLIISLFVAHPVAKSIFFDFEVGLSDDGA